MHFVSENGNGNKNVIMIAEDITPALDTMIVEGPGLLIRIEIGIGIGIEIEIETSISIRYQ